MKRKDDFGELGSTFFFFGGFCFFVGIFHHVNGMMIRYPCFGWVLTGGTAAENGSGAPPASVSDRVVSSWSSSTEQTCALGNEIPGKVQEETTRSTKFVLEVHPRWHVVLTCYYMVLTHLCLV